LQKKLSETTRFKSYRNIIEDLRLAKKFGNVDSKRCTSLGFSMKKLK